jgi:hypothetical protein
LVTVPVTVVEPPGAETSVHSTDVLMAGALPIEQVSPPGVGSVIVPLPQDGLAVAEAWIETVKLPGPARAGVESRRDVRRLADREAGLVQGHGLRSAAVDLDRGGHVVQRDVTRVDHGARDVV